MNILYALYINVITLYYYLKRAFIHYRDHTMIVQSSYILLLESNCLLWNRLLLYWAYMIRPVFLIIKIQ